jgi:protease II
MKHTIEEYQEALICIADYTGSNEAWRSTHYKEIANSITLFQELIDKQTPKKPETAPQMNLETTKRFLGHCDLKKTKKIILIHLSDANSVETRMIDEVQQQTGVSTSAASTGDVYELRKEPC